MLSRIAEALYWMGRYLERADDTSRLLDVHVHRMLAEMGDESIGPTLLSAMGLDADLLPESGVDLWQATELLAYDPDNPSSVAGSLRLARENARGLRETLATEIWVALNRTYHDLDSNVLAARSLGPAMFFQWVRDRVALIGGLIDTLLLHDDGWRFLTIGRCLERVDMTARMIGAVPPDADERQWSGVLVSCGAQDAFLRTHGGTMDASQVLSLLLVDEDFPRSVSFALRTANQCLRAVETGPGGRRGDRGRSLGGDESTIRILGRMRSELEYAMVEDLASDMTTTVDRLHLACVEASALIDTRYFRRTGFTEWSAGRALVAPMPDPPGVESVS